MAAQWPQRYDEAELQELDSLIPEEARNLLRELDEVQTELDAIADRESDEVILIEHKFGLRRAPHFADRAQVVDKIPEFWFTVIMNHPQISSLIEEDEEPLLSFLKNIELEWKGDPRDGFQLIFRFYPNPFIENQEVIKDYWTRAEPEPYCTTTEILWLQEKIGVYEHNEEEPMFGLSFCGWLFTNMNPRFDDVAEIIRDDIWLSPLNYFMAPDIEYDDEDFDIADQRV
ncbi:unnamed protein product, partial [Mesorhabditis spiculigera]